MNIAIILAGGKGNRFGTKLPKQYNDINGKSIIDYVISAAKKASTIDKIVVVMNEEYKEYAKELNNEIVTVPNGKERNYSINNGLEYIKKHYENCDNIIILDGVAPLITPQIIDEYINLLNENDVVVTAKKITGELANYNLDKLNRNDYCIIHSPEAYRLNLLLQYFNPESPYTELAYQLPQNIKLYFNFDFHYNIKITYKYELLYCRELLNNTLENSCML